MTSRCARATSRRRSRTADDQQALPGHPPHRDASSAGTLGVEDLVRRLRQPGLRDEDGRARRPTATGRATGPTPTCSPSTPTTRSTARSRRRPTRTRSRRRTARSTSTTRSTAPSGDRGPRRATDYDRTTDFSYIGLTTQVGEEKQTGGADPRTKTYSYNAMGQRISMTDVSSNPDNTEPKESFTYGNDVHGSPSQLLDEDGKVEASYGYDAYGNAQDDQGRSESLTTGDTEDQAPAQPLPLLGQADGLGHGGRRTRTPRPWTWAPGATGSTRVGSCRRTCSSPRWATSGCRPTR